MRTVDNNEEGDDDELERENKDCEEEDREERYAKEWKRVVEVADLENKLLIDIKNESKLIAGIEVIEVIEVVEVAEVVNETAIFYKRSISISS